MIVRPYEAVPHNTIGFTVFIARLEEPLKRQSSSAFFSRINEAAFLTELAQTRKLLLPSSVGAILSPNVRDIVIENNLFVAAKKNMHAGVQCCGTPIAWPMAIDITIRGNNVHDMDKEHRVENNIATPPEFSLPSGPMGPSRVNFRIVP
jgi:hypothetical protein